MPAYALWTKSLSVSNLVLLLRCIQWEVHTWIRMAPMIWTQVIECGVTVFMLWFKGSRRGDGPPHQVLFLGFPRAWQFSWVGVSPSHPRTLKFLWVPWALSILRKEYTLPAVLTHVLHAKWLLLESQTPSLYTISIHVRPWLIEFSTPVEVISANPREGLKDYTPHRTTTNTKTHAYPKPRASEPFKG